MSTLDPSTEAAIEEALALLKAGKKAEAQKIILPLTLQYPNLPDGWYLLGFTVPDLEQKRYCFQQVLRIDPSNEAAQRQLLKLMQHEPKPEKTPTPAVVDDEDEAESEDRPVNVVLIVVVFLFLLLCGGIGLYAMYGISTNNMVNTLFQQHQCSEIAKYTSFENAFPRSIFSSTFRAYQQMEECQAQQVLVGAVSTQDWPASYTAATAYLTKYPQGTFAPEVREQAGNILLAWSKTLLAQKDYQGAIDKLTMIRRDFPDSSANALLIRTILDDTLLWAHNLFEQKDYENAEKTFKIVTADARATLEQNKQANDALGQLYLAWAQEQVDQGQYDQGLEYYKAAETLNPTLMDYKQVRFQISLKRARAALGASDFNGALGIVNGVPRSNLSEQNQTDLGTLQNEILNGYSRSSSAQAQEQITTAAAGLCKEQLPTLPIFGIDTSAFRFVVQPGFDLDLPEPFPARTPAEFHYVLCITQTSVTIETCEYQKDYVAQRDYYVWEVSVYDLATGKPSQKSVFQGSTPRNCRDAEEFEVGTKTAIIYGDPPKATEIAAWLATLNITQ